MRTLALFLLFALPHIETGKAEIQPNGSYYHHFDTPFTYMPKCGAVGAKVKAFSRQAIHLVGDPGVKVVWTCG